MVDEGLLIQPLQASRKGWKKRFEAANRESALSEKEKEWLDISLDDVEEWEW